MNRDLTIAQWRNAQRHNTPFLKPSPRTSREAFGSDYAGEDRQEDLIVLVLVLLFLVIGFVVASM